jgi:trans-aconitate 2-methyltransferase
LSADPTNIRSMPTWDPDQYLKFGDERARPCTDLLARIDLKSPHRILDLGCGPGNSTAMLAQHWPDAQITGLDSSPTMIQAARQAYPQHEWIVGDIASWTDERPFDLVFSNAALQWVTDHASIFLRLLNQVAAGGALAVQVPANLDAPAQRLMRELAAAPPWSPHFAGKIKQWFVHDVPFYYRVLSPHAAQLDVWVTEYLHVLPSPESILEWYKGTALRPLLDVLASREKQEQFLADYLAGIKEAYPPEFDGRVLFPFRRLFLIAWK